VAMLRTLRGLIRGLALRNNGIEPDLSQLPGLDALTQLIEPFVSVKANPMTDAVCRAGI